MKLAPLLSERPTGMRIVLAVVAPALLGAVTGYVLGASAAGYAILSVLAALGGLAAGLEHDGVSAGAKCGVLGGTVFGAFVLLAHELDGSAAQVELPAVPRTRVR